MPAPTTGTPAMGHQAKLWVVETLPFDESSATCLEFISEGLAQVTSLSYNNGIRGTRQMARERVRKSAQTVGGTITMTPSKTELRTLLPWILGTNESGAGTSGSPYNYVLAETLQEFQILVLKVEPSALHTDEVYLYEGCRVSRATFSASSGSPLTLSLDIEAETEKTFANGSIALAYDAATPVMSGGSSGRSVPSSVPDNATMFMFSDTGGSAGSMALGNADRECFDWTLTIDNVLDTGRFMNSLTRNNIPSMGLSVRMSATVPYSVAEDELYDPDVNSSSPDTNVNLIKFYAELGTNDDVLQFTVGTWNIESRTPTVNGKGEVVLPLDGEVYRKNTSTAKAPVSVDIWTT